MNVTRVTYDKFLNLHVKIGSEFQIADTIFYNKLVVPSARRKKSTDLRNGPSIDMFTFVRFYVR